jgi:Rrf2 family protein
MLSMKAKYGLRAMMHLASRPQEFWQARTLAEAADVPLKFLESILLDLRHQGLIETRRGAQGGYRLAKSPQEITTGQVIRILDGMVAPIQCASQFKYQPCEDCYSPETCQIRDLMVDVRKGIAEVLDGRSLANLALQNSKPNKKEKKNVAKS